MDGVLRVLVRDNGMSSNNPTRSAVTQRKNVTANKVATGVVSIGVGFTFVDQSDDWRSLANKRIVSQKKRHAIRSHVMRSVRHQENAAGVRRPTGRESTRKSSPTSKSSASPDVEIPPSTLDISSTNSPCSSVAPSPSRGTQQLIRLSRSPSTHNLDPFCTLPCGTEPYNIVEGLMQYCFSVFIPMTFPIENKNSQEGMLRRGKILQSYTSRPATFFGMMATVAAHRAIQSGRHYDLGPSDTNHDDLLLDQDFKIMKHHTIVNTSKRIFKQNELDDDAIEAIFGLCGAACMLGNFREVRLHLRYIKKVLVDTGILDSMASPVSAWIPLYDVNCATGMMSRPLFRLPWEPIPLAGPILERINPPIDSPMASLNTGFSLVGGLSIRLMELCQNAASICHFCELNEMESKGLTGPEHELLRCKALELQYDLLSYVYVGSPSQGELEEKDIFHNPLEQIVRLAVMGLCTSTVTRYQQSAGIARALTKHQKSAMSRWLHRTNRNSPVATQNLIAWALFLFVQGCQDQPEMPEFEYQLGHLVEEMHIKTWEEMQNVISQFLYVPSLQGKQFAHTWRRLENIRSMSMTPP